MSPTAAVATHRREGGGRTTPFTGRVSVGVIPPLGVASGSSCASISSALCHRSAGRFSSALMITLASAAEQRRPVTAQTGSGRLHDVRRQNLLRRGAGEGRPPGQQLVAHHAQRVDVDPMVEMRVGAACSGAM